MFEFVSLPSNCPPCLSGFPVCFCLPICLPVCICVCWILFRTFLPCTLLYNVVTSTILNEFFKTIKEVSDNFFHMWRCLIPSNKINTKCLIVIIKQTIFVHPLLRCHVDLTASRFYIFSWSFGVLLFEIVTLGTIFQFLSYDLSKPYFAIYIWICLNQGKQINRHPLFLFKLQELWHHLHMIHHLEHFPWHLANKNVISYTSIVLKLRNVVFEFKSDIIFMKH